MSDALPWERPLGSRVLDERRAEFRVWAPSASTIAVSVGGRVVELEAAGLGV
jgi:1,4-alpha-glucan branching enzyme